MSEEPKIYTVKDLVNFLEKLGKDDYRVNLDICEGCFFQFGLLKIDDKEKRVIFTTI